MYHIPVQSYICDHYVVNFVHIIHTVHLVYERHTSTVLHVYRQLFKKLLKRFIAVIFEEVTCKGNHHHPGQIYGTLFLDFVCTLYSRASYCTTTVHHLLESYGVCITKLVANCKVN